MASRNRLTRSSTLIGYFLRAAAFESIPPPAALLFEIGLSVRLATILLLCFSRALSDFTWRMVVCWSRLRLLTASWFDAVLVTIS